jgi:hypothetical protein
VIGNKRISDSPISIAAAAPARLSEDALAVAIGLGAFVLALFSLLGADALGWLAKSSVWIGPATGLAPAAKAYAGMGGLSALILTWLRSPRRYPPPPFRSGTTSSGSPSGSPSPS